MSQIGLSELQERVAEIAQRSSLGSQIEAVAVEADRDFEGSDFLRVIVELKPAGSPADDDLIRLSRAIESAVARVDDRFPSVRFAGAVQ